MKICEPLRLLGYKLLRAWPLRKSRHAVYEDKICIALSLDHRLYDRRPQEDETDEKKVNQ
jgi:hypothetical protein